MACKYAFVYSYIPQYNPLSSHNVTGMHVFRADLLTLDNQVVSSSLRIPSSTPSFTQLPGVFCVGLRLSGCPPSGLPSIVKEFRALASSFASLATTASAYTSLCFQHLFTSQVSFIRIHHTVTLWKKSSSKSFYLRSLGATFIIVLQFPKTAGLKEIDLPSLCQKTVVKIWFKYEFCFNRKLL